MSETFKLCIKHLCLKNTLKSYPLFENDNADFYYIYHIVRKKSFLSIHVKDFSLHQDILINVFSIGIPVSINNILMSASNVLINNFAAAYSDNVVAGLGVAQRIFTLVILVIELVTELKEHRPEYRFTVCKLQTVAHCFGRRSVEPVGLICRIVSIHVLNLVQVHI